MGGGDRDSDSGGEDMPLGFNPDEEYSVEENSSQSSSSPLGSYSFQRLQEKNEGVTMDGDCGSVFEGSRIPPSYSGPQANHKSRRTACREVLESYDQLKDRSKSLEEGKRKILSYTPGGWMENVIDMKLSDYDVPNTTVLLVIGPKGSGKSSLINRISKVFEDDKFASERAQVSYNSSAGDGTYFLQEYMIPRGSTSFCLYDTRGLSYDSYDSSITLKKWITEGVHHRELVIRPSDNLHLRNRMKCKAHGNGCQSKENRMVNFVIFVVNGLAVLKSIDNLVDEGTKYTQMIAKTFDCPYISFNDDKPVVVVTHGDLLSLNDRARVRVHLGELLGIPPAKQIFDIPESHDEVTEFTIVNMLHYSLEHADKNLPHKRQIAKKARILSLYSYVYLFIILAIAIISICTPPLFIQHPPISKAHAYVPQSEALVDPPLSEALVNGDPRNSEARLDPPKSNVHADPPMSEAPVNVDPPKSEARLDTPKSEVHVDPHKSETHADPSKSKAHTDLPKSKGLANSHQSDEQIIDWSSVRHLWLDES
ncbi:INTERFERON-INDUCED PROTEIN 44 [Salix purpurea]|uniref:INTERFERON-INDUCED PROTEIN 44 n=1 Tax=Salix purpurea TaxID=77065 RepID=A0A9Q0SRT4_SALPP|nr:INTERFERON-INDUCED PROTEIN 44 [Salix purpurea]